MLEEMREEAVSVTLNIFETMLFTFLEPRSEKAKDHPSFCGSGPVFLRGEIGFSGSLSGNLSLTLPLEPAKKMASNFMGLEEEKASESQAIDLVNELCNIICGNLSSRLAQLDRTSAWNLAIPRTRVLSRQEMEGEGRGPGIEVDFDADGDRINLNIQVDG